MCDRVIPRTDVGKMDIIGAFDALVVAAMPARLAVHVLFTLTDG